MNHNQQLHPRRLNAPIPQNPQRRPVVSFTQAPLPTDPYRLVHQSLPTGWEPPNSQQIPPLRSPVASSFGASPSQLAHPFTAPTTFNSPQRPLAQNPVAPSFGAPPSQQAIASSSTAPTPFNPPQRPLAQNPTAALWCTSSQQATARDTHSI